MTKEMTVDIQISLTNIVQQPTVLKKYIYITGGVGKHNQQFGIPVKQFEVVDHGPQMYARGS